MNELRRIRVALGLKQELVADKLKITQQTLSYREQKPEADAAHIKALTEAYPELRRQIEDALAQDEGAVTPAALRRALLGTGASQARGSAPGVEDDALPWAHTHRTPCLKARLARAAAASGLAATEASVRSGNQRIVMPNAVYVGRGDRRASIVAPLIEAVTSDCDLAPETIVAYGSPYMHPGSRVLLDSQRKQARMQVLSSNARRYFYFGYDTEATCLRVERGRRPATSAHYFPQRHVDQHDRLWYEDFGIIRCWPLSKGSAFGARARFVVVVAGCHRLATGVGARLIESAALRKSFLGRTLSCSDAWSAAYRIKLRGNGGYSSSEREERQQLELLELQLEA